MRRLLATLHGRLLLVLAGLMVPVGVLFVLITLATARGYDQEIAQRQNAELAANLVLQSDLMAGDSLDRKKLDDLTKMLAMTNPGVEIYVLDDQGRVLGASTELAGIAQPQVDLGPVERFLTGASPPVRGTDPRRGGRTVFSAAPLPGGNGYLYVVLTNDLQSSIVRGVQTSTVLRLSLWASLVALGLLLVGGGLAFTLLTRRLRRLRRAMLAFRQADFQAGAIALEPPPPHGDEIDEVHGIFLEMAERISRQLGALTKADALRRELVTSISHDLRTPLAALQGYLETLERKAAELPPERQAAFLQAAQQHAVRLGRLIDQLFELSTLDAEAALTREEAFPLTELVQDVVMKFAIMAQQRGVKVEFAPPPELPFVRADIGLIERVLSNLLDNAIRHTPAGGRVAVTLEAGTAAGGDAEVRVRVADTGEGIPPEALPRIFDRFYQAPAERRKGRGMGLGLAITRRILELHGREIEVTSTPGVGTTFCFALPAAAEPFPKPVPLS